MGVEATRRPAPQGVEHGRPESWRPVAPRQMRDLRAEPCREPGTRQRIVIDDRSSASWRSPEKIGSASASGAAAAIARGRKASPARHAGSTSRSKASRSTV